MPDLTQDLRYSLRTLAKSPGFTAIAALTLALGIGVNSAIFSVIDAVMLRPLPYAEPDRLVALWEHDGRHPAARNSVSPANLVDYQRDSRSFAGIASYHWRGYNLTQSGPPERVWGLQITHSFFPLLGGQPELGRSILPEEDRPGHDRVVVLGHEIWQQRLSGDPHILGQTLTLDGEKYQSSAFCPLDSSRRPNSAAPKGFSSMFRPRIRPTCSPITATTKYRLTHA